MNNKKRKIMLGAIIIVAITLSVYLMCHKAKDSVYPVPSDTDTESHIDNSFSQSEKNDMLENMINTVGNIEIFDSVFGNKNSIIYLAAACKDLNTGLESGLAYVTELGVGYIILASDVSDFIYLAEEGVVLSPSNKVTLSLLNASTNEIHDYEIGFTKSNEKLAFVINSSIRKNDAATN